MFVLFTHLHPGAEHRRSIRVFMAQYCPCEHDKKRGRGGAKKKPKADRRIDLIQDFLDGAGIQCTTRIAGTRLIQIGSKAALLPYPACGVWSGFLSVGEL